MEKIKKIQVKIFNSEKDVNDFLLGINMTDLVDVKVYQDTKTTFLVIYKKEFINE